MPQMDCQRAGGESYDAACEFWQEARLKRCSAGAGWCALVRDGGYCPERGVAHRQDEEEVAVARGRQANNTLSCGAATLQILSTMCVGLRSRLPRQAAAHILADHSLIRAAAFSPRASAPVTARQARRPADADRVKGQQQAGPAQASFAAASHLVQMSALRGSLRTQRPACGSAATTTSRSSCAAPQRVSVVASCSTSARIAATPAQQPREQRQQPALASQLLAAGLAVGLTFAAPAVPPAHAEQFASLADIVRPSFAFVDANKDGIITKEELQQTSKVRHGDAG